MLASELVEICNLDLNSFGFAIHTKTIESPLGEISNLDLNSCGFIIHTKAIEYQSSAFLPFVIPAQAAVRTGLMRSTQFLRIRIPYR